MDIEEKVERARELGQAAHEDYPDENSWGFFSYGDGPAAAGGGVGCYMWFSNRDEMLDYLANYLTWFMPGPTSADHEAVEVAAQNIVAEFRNGRLDDETARTKLNEALRHFSQVTWWGRLTDLTEGDSEYARTVRADFRGEDEEDGASEPISPEEMDDFLDSLQQAGL